jgi:diadenosine tetraphosphatase ApaH/serine/threonine PP2A family protein phosphatase
MLIALLTDIHSNREALSACLAHAGRSKVERYAFLGDFVGYGADPGWVLDTVMSFTAAHGALSVLGNHDAAVLHGPHETMNPNAQKVIAWTRAHLTAAHMEFLTGLPLQVEDGERLFVHANAWAPDRWDYITSAFDARSSMAATRCRYTFCGHVHEPALYHMGTDWRASAFKPIAGIGIPLSPQRRWLAIPGSVGQPRDGILAACYASFDTVTNLLTYFRVPYDFSAAARKIRAAGLPESFVVLIEEGRVPV